LSRRLVVEGLVRAPEVVEVEVAIQATAVINPNNNPTIPKITITKIIDFDFEKDNKLLLFYCLPKRI
jgi:hypothetical protein